MYAQNVATRNCPYKKPPKYTDGTETGKPGLNGQSVSFEYQLLEYRNPCDSMCQLVFNMVGGVYHGLVMDVTYHIPTRVSTHALIDNVIDVMYLSHPYISIYSIYHIG